MGLKRCYTPQVWGLPTPSFLALLCPPPPPSSELWGLATSPGIDSPHLVPAGQAGTFGGVPCGLSLSCQPSGPDSGQTAPPELDGPSSPGGGATLPRGPCRRTVSRSPSAFPSRRCEGTCVSVCELRCVRVSMSVCVRVCVGLSGPHSPQLCQLLCRWGGVRDFGRGASHLRSSKRW